MRILRVGVRRRKQAVYFNALVYFPGKAGKLCPVHFFAGIFLQAPFRSGRLGRAGGDGDNHLVWFLFYFISNQNAPGEKPQRTDKTVQSLLLNVKSL